MPKIEFFEKHRTRTSLKEAGMLTSPSLRLSKDFCLKREREQRSIDRGWNEKASSTSGLTSSGDLRRAKLVVEVP